MRWLISKNRFIPRNECCKIYDKYVGESSFSLPGELKDNLSGKSILKGGRVFVSASHFNQTHFSLQRCAMFQREISQKGVYTPVYNIRKIHFLFAALLDLWCKQEVKLKAIFIIIIPLFHSIVGGGPYLLSYLHTSSAWSPCQNLTTIMSKISCMRTTEEA